MAKEVLQPKGSAAVSEIHQDGCKSFCWIHHSTFERKKKELFTKKWQKRPTSSDCTKQQRRFCANKQISCGILGNSREKARSAVCFTFRVARATIKNIGSNRPNRAGTGLRVRKLRGASPKKKVEEPEGDHAKARANATGNGAKAGIFSFRS
jgi:hypothetical protein